MFQFNWCSLKYLLVNYVIAEVKKLYDEDNEFLQSVSEFLQDYMASQPRGENSLYE